MKINLNYLNDKEYQTVNEDGVKLDIDAHSPENKKHQSPVELLLSAVSACVSITLIQLIKKRKKNLKDLKVSIQGERANEHPKKFLSMDMIFRIYSPDLTQEEARKFLDLSVDKYCSVGSSLNVHLTHTFEIIR